jgi:hypothetical protein
MVDTNGPFYENWYSDHLGKILHLSGWIKISSYDYRTSEMTSTDLSIQQVYSGIC